MNEYILVVDDNKALCNTIADQLENKYGNRYEVGRFYTAQDTIEFIREDIDEVGDKLVLVASDERMPGMQGHELMVELKKTHPKTKKIIFSAWSDVEALKSGINSNVNGFVSKADKDHAGDPLFNLIDELLIEYEHEPQLSFSVKELTFKQADTLYEKHQYLKRRFSIYSKTGYHLKESASQEQRDAEMEWDEYDLGGIEKLILSPRTRYLVCLKEGECIGGIRIIDGNLPLEEATCVTDGSEFNLENKFIVGERFSLDHLREQGIYTREISRLVIDKRYRKKGAVVLLAIFRMIEQLTSEQNTLFCTTSMKQMGLFQAIGFELIGPVLNYLNVELIPMMRNRWKILNSPESIPGASREFHQMAVEPIYAPDVDKWTEYSILFNEEAVRSGFYDDEGIEIIK